MTKAERVPVERMNRHKQEEGWRASLTPRASRPPFWKSLPHPQGCGVKEGPVGQWGTAQAAL